MEALASLPPDFGQGFVSHRISNRHDQFMSQLIGNLLVAQSGGPTAVINASLAGVIQEAGRHECIEEIYGGLNGILPALGGEAFANEDDRCRFIEEF